MNPYRERLAIVVGDAVEFDPNVVPVDGFHYPFGIFRVSAVREDGWVKVGICWTDPDILKRASSSEA